MNTSSRFTVAVHVLALLAVRRNDKSDEAAWGATLKSYEIAWSADTNPVVIRRILGELREVGLVHSHLGPKGGFALARPAEQITLLDVYDAVEAGQLFHLHYGNPLDACPVGGHIQTALQGIFEETNEAVRNVLREKTIAQIAEDILIRSGLKKLMNAGMTLEEIEAQYSFENGCLVEKAAAV